MSAREGTAKIPAALGLGVAAGLVITAIGGIVTASLIHAQTIGEGAAGVAAMITILLGAAAASLVAAGKIPNLRLVMCLAGGGMYYLCLLCCAAILFDGAKSGLWASLAVAAAGSLTVYLLGMNRGRRPKYKVPKLRF